MGITSYREHFLLRVENEKVFLYSSTNHQIALKEPVQAEIQSGAGSAVLPAPQLLEIIQKSDHAQFVLEIQETSDSEGQCAMLQTGKSRFKLVCLPPDGYPAWPDIKTKETITLDAGALSDMISKTVYAVATTIPYPNLSTLLCGLLFHIKPNGLINMVGCDGFRLALYTKEVGHNIHEEKKLILPIEAATEINRLVANSVEAITMKINDKHVLFEIGDKHFVSVLIEGDYPDYEKVLPQNDKVMRIKRKDFLKALERVSIVSGDNKRIKLDLSEDCLLLSSVGNIGEGQEELPCEYKGKSLTIWFNARFLIEPLSVMTTEETVRVSLKRARTPIEIKGDNGIEDYRYIVMPVMGEE